MLSKKPGPPVPPRPIIHNAAASASGAPHSLSKSQSTSSTIKMSVPHGRTVIYKSPSYDLKCIANNHDNNNTTTTITNNDYRKYVAEDDANDKDDDNNTSNGNLHKVTASTSSAVIPTTTSALSNVAATAIVTTEMIAINNNTIKSSNSSGATATATAAATAMVINTSSSPSSFDEVKCNNKTEIIIVNNHSNLINVNNEPNVIFKNMENSRQHSSNDSNDSNGNNDNNSRVVASCEPVAPQNVITVVTEEHSPVARPRQNAPSKKHLQKATTVNNENQFMESRATINDEQSVKIIDTTNTNVRKPNDPQFGAIALKDQNGTSGSGGNITNRIEIKNSNLELKNNLKNSTNCYSTVAEKLFTEIIINSHLAEEPKQHHQQQQPQYQTKLEHCIQVRTPSPPSHQQKQHRITTMPSSVIVGNGGDVDESTTTFIGSATTTTTGVPTKCGDDKLNDKKVTFHELLISELAEMHKDDDAMAMVSPSKAERTRRYSSSGSADSSPNGTQRSRIRTSDWVEVGDNGKEVLLSSCQISLEDSGLEDEERLDDGSSGVGDSWDSVKDSCEERMSLPGLPPLPKSLSGLELAHQNNATNLFAIESQRAIPTVNSSRNKPSTLDTQLAILRREMFGLRQLDLSLLSKLWALNESIQEFRTIIQEQDALSPPSPSPSPSDTNSVSSGDEGDSTSGANEVQQQLALQRQQQQQQVQQQVLQQQQQLLQQQQQQQIPQNHQQQIQQNHHQQQHPPQQQQQPPQLQPNAQQQRMRSAPPPPPPSRKAPSRPV